MIPTCNTGEVFQPIPVTTPNRGPLEGIVVLDFSTQKAGPMTTYSLAAMGATVIKIEEPKGDATRRFAPFLSRGGEVTMWRKDADSMSIPALARARGKHGVTLNLKTPQALELYREMVRRADIVIENYASGTADKLGIGYEATRAVNSRIVYCSISGFGAGCMPGRKALDIGIQAASGMMLANGQEGDPPIRVGMSIADSVSSLYATMGITAALYRRERSGQGEYVDVSMLGATTAFLASEEWQALEKLGQPTRTGNFNVKASPFGVFRCRDGHVAIGAGSRDPMAHDLFRIMGHPEWATDPRYATLSARCEHDGELCKAVAAWCRDRSVEEVEVPVAKAGIPVERVRSPSEAMADPLLVKRGELTQLEHPDLGVASGLNTFGLPIRFHCTEQGTGAAAPKLGEHNWVVYRDWLGFEEQRLRDWQAQGVF
ncbi:carnitine dehydratase [Variovorax sp. WS11]|uniref:CaiB/BaiF CoA transferase family protein n=1 Tax=Variovorax sp. WS11 TaxID=1105204 RepID=UPI000D0DB5BC|nr:CoA transferase [Variovorax sp. WS11]NDZ18750.1 CoA transferase [Variovorax sp. WS11]PSL82529.1 carnitine dehydratase [Variovorax sp. WS11]